MSLGERQVLQVLTTLQHLAEMGPKSPTPGHEVHSVQLIMRPLEQTEISFMPYAVLGYGTSIRLSTSIKTDVSCTDVCRRIVATLKHMLSRGPASTFRST